MKYKIGDEVFVRCKIINVDHDASMPYEVCRAGCVSGFAKPLYILAGDEDIEDMTAEEAWETARRICTSDYDGCENALSHCDLDEIFGIVDCGKIMNRYTPQQAKAKIEAWKAEKEIKVGDVVDVCGDKGVVTSFGTDGNNIHVLYFDGIVNSYRKDKDIKKTGRHIDIEGLLKQIGGTVEERNNNN